MNTLNLPGPCIYIQIFLKCFNKEASLTSFKMGYGNALPFPYPYASICPHIPTCPHSRLTDLLQIHSLYGEDTTLRFRWKCLGSRPIFYQFNRCSGKACRSIMAWPGWGSVSPLFVDGLRANHLSDILKPFSKRHFLRNKMDTNDESFPRRIFSMKSFEFTTGHPKRRRLPSPFDKPFCHCPQTRISLQPHFLFCVQFRVAGSILYWQPSTCSCFTIFIPCSLALPSREGSNMFFSFPHSIHLPFFLIRHSHKQGTTSLQTHLRTQYKARTYSRVCPFKLRAEVDLRCALRGTCTIAHTWLHMRSHHQTHAYPARYFKHCHYRHDCYFGPLMPQPAHLAHHPPESSSRPAHCLAPH